MNYKNIDVIKTALAMLLGLVSGCSDDMMEPGTGDEGVVRRRVSAVIDNQDMAVLEMRKTDEPVTKTAINYIDVLKDTTHHVWWETGDKVYSYAESGVYMSYILKREDLLDTLSAAPDRGYQANVEIIYRLGDAYYTAYHTGRGIGSYKGRRLGTGITFLDGVPNEQNGKFSDYHVCIGRDAPEVDEFNFKNLQSYIGFKVIGNDIDPVTSKGKGTIIGEQITKIVMKSVSKENMAGNMQIEYYGGWRYMLENRGVAADSMIVVVPDGGIFKNDRYYFVALPVRKYAKGINIDFYSATGRRLSYVKTPSVTLNYSQIYDCDDILQYVVILMKEIKMKFDGAYIPDKGGITIEKGHTATLTSEVLPVETTDKSLKWTVKTARADTTISVTQGGSLTGLVETGSAAPDSVVVSSNDGSGVKFTLGVKVVEAAGVAPGTLETADLW